MNTLSVKNYSEKLDMLPDGARVLCAVSGGADSTALLHVLCSMPQITVCCAHLNHCLRGDESERDERFVRDLCKQLGVPCFVERADVAAYAAAEGLGIEEAARKLRYDFLVRTAQESGCSRIATAHTADDNAETMLMNLLRGSGLRGLGGIPPRRGMIVRPLLNVTRTEIEEYLALYGLKYVEDSSNEGDAYTRNRIRHQVMPPLRAINPNAVAGFGAAAELLREDEEFLSGLAERFLQEKRIENTLLASELLQLPKPVAMRVLRRMCGETSRTHLDAVYSIAREGGAHAAADLPGMRVVKDFDVLTFGPLPMPEEMPEREIHIGERLELPEVGLYAECYETVLDEKLKYEIYNSFTNFCFHRERICGNLYIASYRPGERLRLAGRGCTKTLKELYAEARYSLKDRAMMPVIYDEAGVAAACGLGTAERFAAKPGDPVIVVETMQLPKEK